MGTCFNNFLPTSTCVGAGANGPADNMGREVDRDVFECYNGDSATQFVGAEIIGSARVKCYYRRLNTHMQPYMAWAHPAVDAAHEVQPADAALFDAHGLCSAWAPSVCRWTHVHRHC